MTILFPNNIGYFGIYFQIYFQITMGIIDMKREGKTRQNVTNISDKAYILKYKQVVTWGKYLDNSPNEDQNN